MNQYNKEKEYEKLEKRREILKELPQFVENFFLGINSSTTYNTQYAYAVDLRIFFFFLEKCNIEVTCVEDLDKISPREIERFLEFLDHYERDGEKYYNGKGAKGRKLATLRKFFLYYRKHDEIMNNPTELVDKPKKEDRAITALEIHQIANLLDIIENGTGMTVAQLRFHEKNRKRDLAIVSLLAATGLRISECVGINIEDVDFNTCAILITGKGQRERFVYFNEEVRKALLEYMNERGKDDCTALFVNRNANGVRRIAVTTVQSFLQKYSKIAIGKAISPHKLRSSFATNLWNETGDIGLVADCLGHKDVNTTKKHYARIQEERKRRAAEFIKLR